MLLSYIKYTELRRRYKGIPAFVGILSRNYIAVESVGLEAKKSRSWDPRFTVIAPKRALLVQYPMFSHVDNETWDNEDGGYLDLAGLLLPEAVSRRREVAEMFGETSWRRIW